MSYSFNQGDRPLEGYTIQRGVGRGGFGEVYHALSDGGKEVALKYLRDNPQIELRGVQNCLNLKSPHLVTIYDVKQSAAGDWFVVMEYVNGPSLRDLLIESPSGLGAQKAAYFLREIGKGLTYLHDRGIVHRDIKPGNIFYEDGYVKICDYGLSKAMSPSQHSGQTMSVGTVHYMAPEVGSGNYSKTIDIYAMGVMLYEMLLGRVPYQGATMGEVLMKHLTAQPEVDQLPAPFPDVIRRSLAKDPNDRYVDMPSMVSAVFANANLEQSVATFEPMSLTQIAAHAAKHVGPMGVGSSNMGYPAVTMSGTPRGQSPGAPPRDTPRGGSARVMSPHARQPADKHVAGPWGAIATAARTATEQARTGKLIEKVGFAGVIVVGLSIVATLVANRGQLALDTVPVNILIIAGMIAGPLAGTWYAFARLAVQGEWAHRFVNTGMTMLCLLPAMALRGVQIGMSSSPAQPQAMRVFVPLIALILLGKWSARVYLGRRGQINWGWAFSAGLFAALVAAMIDYGHPQELFILAGTASVTLQFVAGLWPMSREEQLPAAVAAEMKDEEEDEEDEDEDSDEDAEDDSRADPADGSRGAAAAHPGGVAVMPAAMAGAVPPRMAAAMGEAPRRSRRGRTASDDMDPAWLRSHAARTAWAVGGLLMLPVTAAVFVLFALSTNHAPSNEAAMISTGCGCGLLAFFALTRAIGKRRRGAWRGVLRPLLFTLGLIIIQTAALHTALLNASGADLAAGIVTIIVGATLALGVWIIPVPAWKPALRAADPAADSAERDQRRGRALMIAGGVLCGLLAIMAAALDANLDRSMRKQVMPPVMVTLAMGVAGCFTFGGILLGKANKPTARLSLPMQRTFAVARREDMDDLIQRHFLTMGYRLLSKSRLLWSFERGSWASQFWSSDVRSYRTILNIGAYEQPDGVRLTCYVDVQGGWGKFKQKDIAVFADELDQFERLMTESGSAVVYART